MLSKYMYMHAWTIRVFSMHSAVIPILLIWLSQVSAETFYVTTAKGLPCSDGGAPCFPLREYASMPTEYFTPNTSLVLLPGNHNLNQKLSIKNISSLSIASASYNHSDTVTITCSWPGSFEFESVMNVLISHLILNRCYNNSFSSIGTLQVEECSFHGQNIMSVAAMLLVSIQNVQIMDSVVCAYAVKSDSASSIGSIHVSNSNVSIFNTTFSNNFATTNGAALNILEISSVVIVSCQFINQTTMNKGGAISVESSDIEINDCLFLNNSAESGAVLYMSGSGTATINNSTFVGSKSNSTGAVFTLFYDSLTIENSLFVANEAQASGGALHIISTTLNLLKCQFTDNKAQRAGAIYFVNNITGIVCPINITDTTIENNSALVAASLHLEATTLLIRDVVIQNNKADASNIYILNSTVKFLGSSTVLLNNSGSVYAYSSTITFDGKVMIANNLQRPSSLRQLNYIVVEGGALTTLQSSVYFNGEIHIMNNEAELYGGGILASESTYYMNGNIMISGNTALLGGGIFTDRCEFNFQNSTHIINNKVSEEGGGMFSLASSLRLTSGALRLIGNTARMGGGICIKFDTRLYVIKSQMECLENRCGNEDPDTYLNMEFSHNAADFGGAIFVSDSTASGACNNTETNPARSPCFLQTLALYANTTDITNFQNIYFTNNSANVSGASLFGGLFDRCSVHIFAEIRRERGLVFNPEFNVTGIQYLSQISNVTLRDVASMPVSVCVCEYSKPICKLPLVYEKDQVISIISVKKGQRITVSLVAVDQVNGVVPATVLSSLSSGRGRLGENQFSQRTSGKCTDLEYNIFSPLDSEQISVYPDGPCNSIGISQKFINITFLPCECPTGFEVTDNRTDCICGCDSRLADFITICRIEEMAIIREGSFWIANDNLGGFIIYDICPFDYCISPESQSVAINLNLTDGSDAQCAFNRTGILCGACSGNLSVTFGGSRCMECSNNYWLALTALFAIVGVALVALILICNLTVSIGSINGLVFYANVIAVNRSVFLPFSELNFVSVFIAWVNIEFGLETCFFNGMDVYSRVCLGFAFPAYIIFLVIMIIVISSHSQRFSKLLSNKNPVATLATLILLTYASNLRLIIAIVSFAKINYSDGSYDLVWLVDGNVPFLGMKHTILFILAALIIILGLFYTMFLFTWQWILRCPKKKIFRWITSTKLYSFMDTYHAPYNTKHRYWTGLLLLVRIVIYTTLIPILGLYNDPSIGVFIVACASCGLLMLKDVQGERIYRNRFLNILENSFFYNVIVFSLASYFVITTGGNQIVLAQTSVGIAFITFLLILLYHTFEFVLPRRWTDKLKRLYFARFFKGKTNNSTHLSTSIPKRDFNELRQQLLELDEITQNDIVYLKQADEVPPKPHQVTYTVIDGVPSEDEHVHNITPHTN